MRRGLVGAVVVLLVAVVGATVAAVISTRGESEDGTLVSPVRCVGVDLTGDPSCWEETLYALAQKDPAEALDVYQQAAETSLRVREVCHSLFHAIGQGAAASGREPWDVMLLGSSDCNWGYVHGTVEGFLGSNAETAAANAAQLCTVPPYIDETDSYVRNVAGNCVHGTGHALYLATSDPLASERGCRQAFSDPSDQITCLDGMIMEFGGSQEAMAGNHGDMCENIGADVQEVCYSNIALTWYNQLGRQYEPVLERCEKAPTLDLVGSCITGAASLFAAMEGFDARDIDYLCQEYLGERTSNGGAGTRYTSCVLGAAISGVQGVLVSTITPQDYEQWFAEASAVLSGEERSRVESVLDRTQAGFGDGIRLDGAGNSSIDTALG